MRRWASVLASVLRLSFLHMPGSSGARIEGMLSRRAVGFVLGPRTKGQPGLFTLTSVATRRAAERKRTLSGARTFTGVANGYIRGRQWNGKPVLDTVVLHPHSDIAQPYWSSVMEAGDVVVDATCGNGWDSLYLLRALAAAGGSSLMTCDIQVLALENAKSLLARELSALLDIDRSPEPGGDVWVCRPNEEFLQRHPAAGPVTLHWKLQSHLDLMKSQDESSIKVVVFNLGYLPGGDKNVVTVPEVTMATIEASRTALREGGCISVTCYPGHAEGRMEEEQVQADARRLPVEIWSCYLHQWINQRNKRTGKPAPSLVLYQRVAPDPLDDS